MEELPFDQTSVRNIVVQLCSQDAGIVESEYLEIKGWCHDERQLAEKVSEAAACIANANGGWVLVGVDEDDTRRSKFSACPHPCITVEWLVQRIHDLTMPPVEHSVNDISYLVQDITGIQSANAFLVTLPKSKKLSGHVTIKGISKIRNGKECRPYYSIEDDRTKAPIQSLSISELSSDSIKWAIERHSSKFGTPQNYWEGQGAFLAHVGLIERFSPSNTSDLSYRVLLAGLLLFGKQSTLNRYANIFETVVITEKGTTRFCRNIVESYRELCLTKNSLLPSLCPKIPLETIQELLVNAYVHRSYRLNGPVTIRISDLGIEVESPGELPVGIHADNLIHCIPIYRNFLLAEGSRYLGLCDRVGRGIDSVYESILSNGFGFPSFESVDNRFTARIPSEGNPKFREYVMRNAHALNQLDEIIVLRLLWDKAQASSKEIYSLMQRGISFGQTVLDRMFKKSMIEPVDGSGTSWQMHRVLRHEIDNIFHSAQLNLDLNIGIYGDL